MADISITAPSQCSLPELMVDASAAENGRLTVPGRGEFLGGDFARGGDDLAVTLQDGSALVRVKDYFMQEVLPDLVTEGGAIVPASLVKALAGSPFAFSLAQSDGDLPLPAQAGQLTSVEGKVTIQRADGSSVEAETGQIIYESDTIVTGGDGRIAMLFQDGTEFSLGTRARMVVSEFQYDSSDGGGQAILNVTNGAFSFISGTIAKSGLDHMKVETPAMSLGIRGTMVAGDAGQQGEDGYVMLLREPDGKLGKINVVSRLTGTETLIREANTLFETRGSDGQEGMRVLDTAEVALRFAEPLTMLSRRSVDHREMVDPTVQSEDSAVEGRASPARRAEEAERSRPEAEGDGASGSRAAPGGEDSGDGGEAAEPQHRGPAKARPDTLDGQPPQLLDRGGIEEAGLILQPGSTLEAEAVTRPVAGLQNPLTALNAAIATVNRLGATAPDQQLEVPALVLNGAGTLTERLDSIIAIPTTEDFTIRPGTTRPLTPQPEEPVDPDLQPVSPAPRPDPATPPVIVRPDQGVITPKPPEDPVRPVDPVTPVTPSEPKPDPVDPTPDPAEPTPDPAEPTPDPVEPTPDPVEPTPDPIVPTPDPVEPTPDPVEPTPDPVPSEPPLVLSDDLLRPALPGGVLSLDILGNDQVPAGSRISQLQTDASDLSIAADGQTLLLTPGAVTQALALNQSRQIAAEYTVTAPDGRTATGKVEITLLGQNDPPTAQGDQIAIRDNGAATHRLALLTNDRDPDSGARLRIVALQDVPADLALTLNQTSGELSLAGAGLLARLGPGETVIRSFTYVIADEHGARSSASATVTLTGRDDPTSLTGGNRLVLAEDGQIGLGQFILADADESQKLTLSVTLGPDAPVRLKGGGTALTVSGTVAELNAWLKDQSLQGLADAHGSGTLTINVSRNGESLIRRAVTVEVTPQADATQIELPAGGLTGTEDTALPLSGVVIRDADSQEVLTLTLTLASEAGSLITAQGEVVRDGLTLTGTAAELTAKLAALSLQPEADRTGPAKIELTLRDSQGQTQSRMLEARFESVTDAPVILATDKTFTGTEDTVLPIEGLRIRDADGGSLTLTITASGLDGRLSLKGAEWSSSLTLKGTGDEITAALKDLLFKPGTDKSGWASVTLQVTDAEGNKAEDNLSLTVQAAPDVPRLTGMSRILTGSEDAALALWGLGVTDPDPGEMLTLDLTISGSGATLRHNALSGSSLRLTGTATELSQALNRIEAQAGANQSGSALIEITATDSTGRSSRGVLSLNFTAVADKPVLTLPSGTLIGTEDSALSLAGLRLSDADPGDVLTLTLSLSGVEGDLCLPGTTSAETLTLTGTAAELTTRLESLQLKPDADIHGFATIGVTVRDSFGQTTTGSFGATINPVNDAPVLSGTPTPRSLVAGTETLLGALGLTVGDKDSARFSLSVGFGNSTGWAACLSETGLATLSNLTLPQVREYLDSIRVTAAGTGSATLRVTVSDGTASASQTIALTATPQPNRGVTATGLEGDHDFDPGVGQSLGAITLTDPDAGESVTARFSLSQVGAAVISASAGSFNAATGVWTMTGSVAAVQAAISSLQVTPAVGRTDDFSVFADIRDGLENGAKPVTGRFDFLAAETLASVTPRVQQGSGSTTLVTGLSTATTLLGDGRTPHGSVALQLDVLAVKLSAIYTPDAYWMGAETLAVQTTAGTQAFGVLTLPEAGSAGYLDPVQAADGTASVFRLDDGSGLAVYREGTQIYGRHLDLSGIPIGDRVNLGTSPSALQPFATRNDGGVALIFSVSDTLKLFYAPDEGSAAWQTTISHQTASLARNPGLSTNDNGQTAVVWQTGDAEEQRLWLQVFSRDGTAGTIREVVTLDDPGSGDPRVIALKDGRFLTAWSNDHDIYGQIVSASGVPVGTAQKLCGTANTGHDLQTLTLLEDGKILLVMTAAADPFGGGSGLVGRILEPTATGLETARDDFAAAPTFNNGNETEASAVALGDGGYAIAYVTAGSGQDVIVTRYSAAEAVLYSRQLAAPSLAGNQNAPQLVGHDDGRLTVIYAETEGSERRNKLVTLNPDGSIHDPLDPFSPSGAVAGGSESLALMVSPSGRIASFWTDDGGEVDGASYLRGGLGLRGEIDQMLDRDANGGEAQALGYDRIALLTSSESGGSQTLRLDVLDRSDLDYTGKAQLITVDSGSDWGLDRTKSGGMAVIGMQQDKLYAWTYDSDLNLSGARITVDGTAGYAYRGSDLAGLSNGSFVATYIETQGNTATLEARIFSATGQQQGSTIQINTETAVTSDLVVPAITDRVGGGFLVTWIKSNSSNHQLFVASYNNDGSSDLPAVKILQVQGESLSQPTIVELADQSIAIGWISSKGNGQAVAQIGRYDAATGEALQAVTEIALGAGNADQDLLLQSLHDGGFAVQVDVKPPSGGVQETETLIHLFNADGTARPRLGPDAADLVSTPSVIRTGRNNNGDGDDDDGDDDDGDDDDGEGDDDDLSAPDDLSSYQSTPEDHPGSIPAWHNQ